MPKDRTRYDSNHTGATLSFVALTSRASPASARPVEHDVNAYGAANIPLNRQSSATSCFAPEVEEGLAITNPAALSWLHSRTGILFQGALIFFYIALETVGGLLTSFALNPAILPAPAPAPLRPLPSSIIVMNSACSIIIGLMITAVTNLFCERKLMVAIRTSFSSVFQWRKILKFSVVAALFSVSSCFSMLAYSKLDAGLKKIIDQLKLPVTVAMSAVIVGRRYSLAEWLTLLMILLAVVSFYMADVEHDKVTEMHTTCQYPPECFNEPSYDVSQKVCGVRVDGPTLLGFVINTRFNNGTHHELDTLPMKSSENDWTGLIFCLLAILFNCTGSLFDEKLMQSDAIVPFPTQKVQMETTGLPVAILMSFIVPLWIDPKGGKAVWWVENEMAGSGAGFFQGYSSLTALAIFIDIVNGWMGGIIVKKFSSVVKIISKCFALLLTVFASGTLLKDCQADPLPMTMYSLAFIITSATVLFASMPKNPPPAATDGPAPETFEVS